MKKKLQEQRIGFKAASPTEIAEADRRASMFQRVVEGRKENL